MMRFFGHDPEAERRKGGILLGAGGLVAAAVLAGVFLAPGQGVPSRILASGFAGGIFALCFAAAGLLALKDAAALRRERSLRGPAKPLEARAALRPRPPVSADPI